MYKRNANQMGCCGFSPSHEEDRPISLFGVVDSEEESKDFLARCAEQAKRMHPKYPYGSPFYWSFKHPDVNRWYVSYQVPCQTGSEYKDSEIVNKKLVYTKSNDTFKIEKVYKDPSPLDVYRNPSLLEYDEYVSYLQAFGDISSYFFEREKQMKKGCVVACTLHNLATSGSQAILKHITTKREVLHDVKWHNPFYEVVGEKLCDDNDHHTLHTFFYRMS